MLILYHDVPSAGALVAVLRLQRLADEGLPVAFRGIDVLGLEMALPATLDDLEDWRGHRDEAAALGWALPRPRRHPATLRAHLVGTLAEQRGLDAAWRLGVCRAHWLQDRDVSRPQVLTRLAAEVGLDDAEVADLLDDAGARHRLRQQMLVRRGDGIGGVPVLEAGGTFMSPAIPDEDLRTLAAL